MIDQQEVDKLQKNLIEPLLQNCPPQLWSSTIIDLGNYPMNPHLNNEIRFQSQVDEIQQGTIFLEGTYELKQKLDGSTVKIFQNQFEPPDDSDTTHVIRFTDCSNQLDLRAWEFNHTDFLVFNEVTADDMIGFVSEINQRIHSYRLKLVNQTKLIMAYVLLGIVFMAIFITLIAVYLSAWLSFIVVLAYFIGLFLLQRRSARISATMEKYVFFNLAFSIHNLNKTVLEKQFRMRCKLGHLGQWIEFHSLRRKSQTEEEQSKSEQVDLLDPPFVYNQKPEKSKRVAPDTSMLRQKSDPLGVIQEEKV